MKIINIFFLALVVLIGVSSCQEDKLQVWTEKGRVWFTSATDTVASFKKYSETTQEILLEIPLSLAGTVSSQNREVSVKVSKDVKNTRSRYEIQYPVVVAAGEQRGLLKLKVFKTENLNIASDTLELEIGSSTELDRGVLSNLKKKIVLSNLYNRPSWWYDFRMGTWSEAKHQTIVDVLGSDDDVRGGGSDENFRRGWDHADAIYNLYLLNQYCKANSLPYGFGDGL